MINIQKSYLFWLLIAISINISSESMQDMGEHDHHHGMGGHSNHTAKMHGPIGLMGDHLLKKGQSMVSIRYMKMSMNQNYLDSKKMSDAEILQLPNPYGMPKNLSVVPQDMDMDMIMLGAMYAPTDQITFMSMTTFSAKSMNLRTYQPMMNRNALGNFSTKSSDLSIINLSALLKIYDKDDTKFHAQIGIEKNIGKSDANSQVLMPMGNVGSIVMPYGMQGGDKSLSLLSAITYTKTYGVWKMGGQIRSKTNIKNKEWNFGDSDELNIWGQRDINNISAWSLRVKVQDIKPIDGADKNIKAPVQTADPMNYGGKTVSLGIGINILLPRGSIGLETYKPISRDLNGPQMGMDWALQAGYQLSF